MAKIWKKGRGRLGARIEMRVRWELGKDRAYEEFAIIGVGDGQALSFWSFTSDGKRSEGMIADVSDVHPEAIGFDAQMPAGLARMMYWPDEESGFRWAVESRNKKGWHRFTEHRSAGVSDHPLPAFREIVRRAQLWTRGAPAHASAAGGRARGREWTVVVHHNVPVKPGVAVPEPGSPCLQAGSGRHHAVVARSGQALRRSLAPGRLSDSGAGFVSGAIVRLPTELTMCTTSSDDIIPATLERTRDHSCQRNLRREDHPAAARRVRRRLHARSADD